MIGETGERKSAVATPDGKSRKKKKNCNMYFNYSSCAYFVSYQLPGYLHLCLTAAVLARSHPNLDL